MTVLQFKSWIYRRTGIFLAYKEQCDYLESKEFWTSFKKQVLNKKNDMSMRDIQGLYIGLWQCKHGFVRAFKRRLFK